MLELNGVTKVYKTGTFGGSLLTAVSNVSLSVSPARSSRSSARAAAARRRWARWFSAHPGHVGRDPVDGEDVSTLGRRALRNYYGSVQGVFQDPFSSYNPVFKVDRVLEMMRSSYLGGLSPTEWHTKLRDSLESVGLEPRDVLGKYPHQLSGGQLQRLLIARALLLDIKYLVADEIISMLDASTRIDVLNLLGGLKERGLGVLFVTHDLSLGNYISDRAVILRHGVVVELGPTRRCSVTHLHIHPGPPRVGAAAAREVDDDARAHASEDPGGRDPAGGRPRRSGRGTFRRPRDRRRSMSRVALQLYTVRAECAADLAGALARTAALGIEGVELHDLYGHSAEAFRALLDENGLVACGCHTGVARVENELETVAAELHTLGTDRLVVPWIEPPQTTAEADAAFQRLLVAAERTTDLGLRFGFHNHDGELRVQEDGRTLLDRLLDAPADLLFLEVDLGWVWYAGGDPMALSSDSASGPHCSTSRTCRRVRARSTSRSEAAA